MKSPMVRLVYALYGHPDSGTFWGKHCDEQLRKIGFLPVGADWPSAYRHDELRLFLIVYVDDFKLAGPIRNLPRGWELIRKHLEVEEAKTNRVFLGCNQLKENICLPNGVSADAMIYFMRGFMEACVLKYR
jgi:hypothetical protein